MNDLPDNGSILITGVAGLIGYNFATWLLLHTNHQVIGVDALAEWGNHNEVSPNMRYTFYKMDLSKDSKFLNRIIKEHNVKVIYHFAAYAAEGLSPFMRYFNYVENTLVSANIINAAINHGCKLIFTSSMAVYGHGRCMNSSLMFDENDLPQPVDPYGIAKYGVEQDIRIAGEQHGLNWVIIRPHNVFGIGQNINDSYRNVIGIWMHQSYMNEPLTIYGDGDQERAFTYVDNIMEPLYKAMNLSYKTINLGGAVGITINEASKVVQCITGNTRVIHKEPRHEVRRAIPDPTRSITLLDYKDTVSFDEGVKRMWDWVRLEKPVRGWYEWKDFEIDKGIYEYWRH